MNRSEGAQKTDVSSENQFITSDKFYGNLPSEIETVDIKQNLPDIFVDRMDMNDVIEDGIIDEFIDHIEHIDNNDVTEVNKLQFKIYSEPSKRLRYPSYNYEADKSNEDDFENFSIVENEKHEPNDLANENIPSNFNSELTINNRESEMFTLSEPSHVGYDDENNIQNIYRPIIRITSTEDERIEQFLHENCDEQNENENEHKNEYEYNHSKNKNTEILIKSKTTQMFHCNDVENSSDIESFGSDSRTNSPSLESARRDSLMSDIGSEPIQFGCKQSTKSNEFYNREDSSSSYKSNVLFERSQSRFSELEYIKGRDDWKDSYIRYDISEEIDSDNYHHLRRHSEAADTLEYIRGREDWLRNEIHHANRNSLGKIFEMGERKIVIQDEIDSDEYHHNFLQNEFTCQFNEASDKQEKSLNVDTKSNDDYFDITKNDDSKNPEWSNVDIENTSSKESSISTSADRNFNKNNDISNVIKEFITHETTHTEDIEITVMDLTINADIDNISDQTNINSHPFIVISEATDENRDVTSDKSSEQTPEQLFSDSIKAEFSINDINLNNTLGTENSIQNDTDNKYSNLQSLSDDGNQQDEEIALVQTHEISPQNNRMVRAKSERLNSMSIGLLKPTEQKLRRTLSFENVEDLIRDVSAGPFFHK